MKKQVLLSFISLYSLTTTAQNNVGIGTTSPHPSAILELSSNNKGLLIPRLTSTGIDDLSNAAKGLLVYDSTNNRLCTYNGNSWNSYYPGPNNIQFPFQHTGNYTTPAFTINNQSLSTTEPTLWASALSGHAIYGITVSNFYSSVFGENTGSGKGVSGLNTSTGHGVHARGTDGTALYADIPNGSGIAGKFKQTNTAGKALEVEGNVRLFGGNTNPGAGKVLTSDASGNASWQAIPVSTPTKVGFAVSGIPWDGSERQVTNTWNKMHFASEHFDIANTYTNKTQTPSSTFTAPLTGLYQLNASVGMIEGQATELSAVGIKLMLKRNTTTTEFAQNLKYRSSELNTDFTAAVSGAFYLLAGDQVWVECWGKSADGYIAMAPTGSLCFFNGFLVMQP